jgi:hypothetical protein
MTFLEFLSPLLRRKHVFFSLFIAICALFTGVYVLLPQTTKVTLYFSIKPLATTEKSVISSNEDRSEKLAEGIAGWEKDPYFRESVLKTAKVWVPNFKRKITARKQNRMNVFWTIQLINEEQVHAQVLAESLVTVLNANLDALNAETEFPVEITEPRIFSETQDIPLLWVIPAILILAFGFSIISIYAYESLGGRVSYMRQIQELLPESPILRVNQEIEKHDSRLLEQFIMTFDSPQIIGTFPVAGQFFQLAPQETIDEVRDTPILLVKLGETKLREIENLIAIFGDELGLIVFEK